MAEYLILIYEDEKTYADADPSVYAETLAAHGRFAEQIVEHGGKLIGGQALQPVSTATTIRGDVVTDGPSPRPRRRSAVTTWSTPKTWTRRWPSLSSARHRAVGWRCGR